MTIDFTGVFVPVTTPFSDDGATINYGALHDNVRRLLGTGANGILAAGSTGEAPLLTEDESVSVTREVRNAMPDKTLLVGTGRESTAATVAACRRAYDAGADAALVRAPAYFHTSMHGDALRAHFERIADESPIPVLVYNMPKYTHVNFSAGLIETLSRHQNIIGAKDSSGDIANFESYVMAAPRWSLLVGSGAALLGGLKLGATGGIVAVANFACELAVAVYSAYCREHFDEATGLQERLAPLHRSIVGAHGPAGVKAAMDRVGMFGGLPRAPLVRPTDEVIDEIAKLVN